MMPMSTPTTMVTVTAMKALHSSLQFGSHGVSQGHQGELSSFCPSSTAPSLEVIAALFDSRIMQPRPFAVQLYLECVLNETR